MDPYSRTKLAGSLEGQSGAILTYLKTRIMSSYDTAKDQLEHHTPSSGRQFVKSDLAKIT